jgi:hypothetical protein
MKLDKDGSGSIDKEEFLAIPQIATNPLASRLIAIMDEDGGGDVDFKEFIAGLSAFSNKGNKIEKLRCKCRYILVFLPSLSLSVLSCMAEPWKKKNRPFAPSFEDHGRT